MIRFISTCLLVLCGASLGSADTEPSAVANSSPRPPRGVWEYHTAGCLPHAARLSKDDLILGTCARSVHRISKTNGKKIWTFAVPDSLGTAVHGTPAISDSLIFFGTDGGWEFRTAGALYAIRSGDGSLRWKLEPGFGISGEIAVSKNLVYAITLDDRLIAVSKLTGKVLWDKQSKWFYYASVRSPLVSSPLVSDSIIYFPGRDSTLYALRAKDGSTLWECKLGDEPLSRATLIDNQILLGTLDSVLSLIDIRTGKVTASRKLDHRPVKIPLITDSAIFLYLADRSNEPRFLAAFSRDLKEEKWRAKTTDQTESPYFCSNQLARINGAILAGTYDGLVLAFDERNGEFIWDLSLPGPITLVQTVDSLVLAGNLSGELVLQKPKTGLKRE